MDDRATRTVLKLRLLFEALARTSAGKSLVGQPWKRGAAAVLVLSCGISAVASCKSTAAASSPCDDFYDATIAYEKACTPGALIFPLPRDRTVKNCQLTIAAPDAPQAANDIAECAKGRRLAAENCSLLTTCPFSPGNRADGQPCGTNAQCSSTFCSGSGVSTTGETCGVCTPRIADGAACDPTNSACAFTSVCLGSGKKGTCAPIKLTPLGGACDTTHLCDTSAFCAPGKMPVCTARGDLGAACALLTDCKVGTSCLNGACVQAKPAGAACSIDGMDDTDCLEGLYCDPNDGICKAPAIGGANGQCDGVKTICETSCVFPSADAGANPTGFCQIVIPDGTECDPAHTNESCDIYAYCVNNVCQYYDPATCK